MTGSSLSSKLSAESPEIEAHPNKFLNVKMASLDIDGSKLLSPNFIAEKGLFDFNDFLFEFGNLTPF